MKPIFNQAAPPILAAGLLLFSGLGSAFAEDTGGSGDRTVVLELNKTEDAGEACRLSFVMENATGQPLSAAAYELVLFTADGVINQMSVFDFGALPVGKTVVRQFELPAVNCAEAGQLLINGPAGCTENAASPHCSAPLTLNSRTGISLTR